jgi:DNA (cytosine-5)-methyltransferase 1
VTGYSEPTDPVGTVAELFAGVGGFRIGLARAGWKTVFSNQWEPSTRAQHAASVYVHRFGIDGRVEGHITADIAEVLKAARAKRKSKSKSTRVVPKRTVKDALTGDIVEVEIPEFDMLVGGFPCQDYSVAKSLTASKGLEGKKGVLWWQILDLIDLRKPKYILLENVDRLLKSPASQRGRDFAIMLASLTDAKYFVEWRVVNAAEYGFPQRRRRVFIVAKKLDTVVVPDPQDSDFLTRRSVLARALPVLPQLTEQLVDFELRGSLDELTTDFGVGLKHSPFKNAGYASGRQVTTAHLVPNAERETPLSEVLIDERLIPSEYFISDEGAKEKWRRQKEGKSVERTNAEGWKYNYSEGSMSLPDSIDKPARTILTAEGGTSASRFKHVILAKDGKRWRRLVPQELEALNGFPLDWSSEGTTGPMSDVRRAFFMGNALVIGIVERIGSELSDDIKSLSGR